MWMAIRKRKARSANNGVQGARLPARGPGAAPPAGRWGRAPQARRSRASETHPEKNRGRANTEIVKSKSALPGRRKKLRLKKRKSRISDISNFYNRLVDGNTKEESAQRTASVLGGHDHLTAAFTRETRSGRVIMDNRVDIATRRLASSESRLNLVAKSAQEAATGAPNITARVSF